MNLRLDWQRLASMLFCILIAVLAVFLIGKYVLIAVLPFLIAWSTALLLRPLAKYLSEKSGIGQNLCALFLLILLFLLLGLLLVLIVNRLLAESGKLLVRLSEESDKISAYLGTLIDRLEAFGTKIPILHELSRLNGLEALGDYMDTLLTEIAKSLTTAVTTKLPGLIAGFISSLPSFLLFFVISVIASFYFTLDLDTIQGFMVSFLPTAVSARIPDFQKGLKNFLSRYFKAYALILFLTFCELYVGFSVLSLEYSFLLAILISLVDIFPVLGVGTVILPWAAIALIGGNYHLGFGLVILWGVVTIVRQIIEPRIVGGTLGVHPILMLIAMYLGFRFFGILGILLSPAILMLARFAIKEFRHTQNASLHR